MKEELQEQQFDREEQVEPATPEPVYVMHEETPPRSLVEIVIPEPPMI